MFFVSKFKGQRYQQCFIIVVLNLKPIHNQIFPVKSSHNSSSTVVTPKLS